MLGDKNEQKCKFFIYTIFCFLVLCIHIPMTYVGDDLLIVSNLEKQSLVERFKYLYFYNGRICTDVLANVFYRMPMAIWKVVDTGIYIAIAMLISRIFTRNTYKDVLLVCMLILLFPMDYIATAGYICVSTNYVYTLLGVLLISIPIKRVILGRKIPVFLHVVSAIAMIYVSNHDQAAMVLIGSLLLILAYMIVTRADKKIVIVISIYLVAAICMYIYMFFMPGHINRMNSTAEMEVWLPEYAEWSFLKKIYRGYTSTVAHVIYNNVKLFGVFCLLLFLVAINTKSIFKMACGIVPSLSMVMVELIGKERFIHFNYYLPDLLPVNGSLWNIVPLLLSVVIIGCIMFTILSCVKDNQNKCLLILLLILAAGSREMMGFSATIYASNYRTFTMFLYAIIIGSIVLLKELENTPQKELWYVGVATIVSAIVI